MNSESTSLPSGWTLSTLAAFDPFVTSGSRGWAKYYSEMGDAFIRITNLTRDQIALDLADLRYVRVPQGDSEGSRTSLRAGDILISITADIGIIGLVDEAVPLPAYINQHIAVVRFPAGKLNSKFVAYSLATTQSQKRFRELTDAGAKAGMSLDTIRKLGLLAPQDPDEQQAIAQALSDVDDLIASLDALIAKKRDIKQGAMQQLLTGKRRLPGFSGEWQKVEFAKFLPLQRGFDLPSNLLRLGPFPVVYSNGVANWHSKGPCDGPGIVTGRSGTIGKVTYVEGAYWPHNTSLWVTSFAKCHPRFGFHFLVYSDLGRFSSGSGVPTLNRNDFSGWWINVPADLHEQKAIADCLDALIAEIDALEEKAAKMEAIREGMMQQLLTGRIRLA